MSATWNVIANITTSEEFEVRADTREQAKAAAIEHLHLLGHSRDDIEISELDEVADDDEDDDDDEPVDQQDQLVDIQRPLPPAEPETEQP